jgi:acyl carrier protein
MDRKETTRQALNDLLAAKLRRFGIGREEIDDRFDLVKSGLLNSLEFVEVLSALEKRLGVEIDFESALADKDFTTVNGVVRNIDKLRRG